MLNGELENPGGIISGFGSNPQVNTRCLLGTVGNRESIYCGPMLQKPVNKGIKLQNPGDLILQGFALTYKYLKIQDFLMAPRARLELAT